MPKPKKLGRGLSDAPIAKQPHAVHKLSMPTYLSQFVKEAMEAAMYTPHQRSLWIEEALAGLIVHDSGVYASATGDRSDEIPEELQKRTSTKTNVRQALDRQLQILIHELQLQGGSPPPTFSYVARCAIRHRLRHPELYPRTSEVTSKELIERAIALDLTPPY